MSLAGDRNRAKALCDRYLTRTIGQYTDTQVTGAMGMGRMMGALFSGGTTGVELLRGAKRGASPLANIDYWVNLGQAEAGSTTGTIRCQGSAALIAYLLSGNRGVKTTFDIISQGDPKMHGHWFVVVNNNRQKPVYPNTFAPNSFVVDIWGAIHAKTNQGRNVNSSVVHPSNCLFSCGDGENGLKVVAQGQGGYESSGCCFLTTAACESLGLRRDCEELRVLRWFRDEVLENSDSGRKDLEEYYAVAPSIVDAIDRHPARDEIYTEIFAGTIQPAVLSIRRGDYARAYSIYASCVSRLRSLPTSGN